MSAPVTAVRLMGVVCTVDSRFSAVTTTSSSCKESDRGCCASADSASRAVESGTQPKTATHSSERRNISHPPQTAPSDREGSGEYSRGCYAPPLVLGGCAEACGGGQD